jgi:hypothetical protein
VTLESAELLVVIQHDVEKEAWNLPTIKLNSSIDFNITQNGLRVPLLLCRGT